jgi:hypothetical protein
MCKLSDKCSTTKGPCIHEWMMMGVAAIAMLAAAGHFVFNWF